jgi:plastocyanin
MRRLVMLAAVFVALLAGCGRGQSPTIGAGTPSGPAKTDLAVVAKNTAFNPTTLTAPAGKALTITFRNEDATAHSFHLFAGTAGDVKTDVKAGPSTDVLHVTLQVPAAYTYQCDVHPTVMKGTLVVVKDTAASS